MSDATGATAASGAQSGAATQGAPPKKPLPQVLLRRLVIALILSVVLAIPAVIMGLLSNEPAASGWASMAAIAGLVAVAAAGPRIGILTAIVMGLLAPVSIIAGMTPITGAALMALMCLMLGRLSRFGLHRATVLVVIFIAWTLISPPPWGPSESVMRTNETYLAWMGAIFFVGALVPVLIMPFLLRKMKRPAPVLHTREEAIPYTVSITVLSTVATYYVLANPTDFAGAFLVATILVLTQVGDAAVLKPTLYRVIGTILGSTIVVLIVAQIHSLAIVYLIGLILGTTAVIAKFGPHQWLYYTFITPTAVCLNALSIGQVGELGQQRFVDNVAGAALVLIASGLTIAYSQWQAKHGHVDEAGQATQQSQLSLVDPR